MPTALIGALRDRHLLLVLDDLKQAVAAALLVAEMLEGAPRLTVPATRREPLRLRAEHRFPVESLALSDPGAAGMPGELVDVAAVALFLQRAPAVDRRFAFTRGTRRPSPRSAGGSTGCHSPSSSGWGRRVPGFWRRRSTRKCGSASTGILICPAIIADELERPHGQDPTTGDLDAIEPRLGEIARHQGNLVRRVAEIEDDGLAALVHTELAWLTDRAWRLAAERDALHREREGWRFAQERLDELEGWCRDVAANLGDLSYEQKRLALTALGVEVKVWRADHSPRFEIRASIPFLSTSSS